MEIELDLNESIESNASKYYDKVKKFKKKLEGVNDALVDSRVKLDILEKDKEKIIEELNKKQEKKEIKLEWYEKFRWFYTSDGFLVIGGRDATSNEIVIKKHTESNDLVFHTDMIGSPFFVIKTEGGKITDSAKKQVADATVTFSRAFKLGLRTTPTFMAKPSQLTKEAKPGEYVPRGGFVTKGKLEYIDNDINLAVGNYKDKVMAGPIEAIKKHCEKYVLLDQGKEKPGKVAKLIQKEIGLDLDTIIRVLPAGTFRIRKK
jgi:predicted ribosome quality control (RQC) complex YloA/Tae2 family protein